MGRDWKADAWVYLHLRSPPSVTVYGLPPQLLVSSANIVLELAHTSRHHRASYSQCDPGNSEGQQKTRKPCRGMGELMFVGYQLSTPSSV